jgi:hypothetical protein
LSGFPSNDRFALCLFSKEHLPMDSSGDAPWSQSMIYVGFGHLGALVGATHFMNY